MSPNPKTTSSAGACVAAWRRQRRTESLSPLVERYLAFVHASAHRRTGNSVQAEEVTRSVFLVLARRARNLPKKTVLAGWLFQITGVACRKLVGTTKRTGWQRWFFGRPKHAIPPDAPLWTRVEPALDTALDR